MSQAGAPADGCPANDPSARPAPERAGDGAFLIGALAPLSRPGWTEAGRHLLAGLELGVDDVNRAGGVEGRPLELVVRDTAGDPRRAATAVEELASQGVTALAGEYHSVAARAAATRAEALGLPFLCSSAVLDALTDAETELVARIAPAQSHGWTIYADYLLDAGHRHVALAVGPGPYWSSGARILQCRLEQAGGGIVRLDASAMAPPAIRDALVRSGATALLLLVGMPDPAVAIVGAVRRDPRLAHILLGAPAGQPEFGDWLELLFADGAGVPFLRYLPDRLGSSGLQVEAALRERLNEAPSFVAFEGHDTIVALGDMLLNREARTGRMDEPWSPVSVEGSRGRIVLGRATGISVRQWTWAPVQVVDRDPADPSRLRILRPETR